MRFWKAAIPNLAIALNIALLIVVYLDRRNPMMGFLYGAPFATLVIATCVCSIISAVLLYASHRNGKKQDEFTKVH